MPDPNLLATLLQKASSIGDPRQTLPPVTESTMPGPPGERLLELLKDGEARVIEPTVARALGENSAPAQKLSEFLERFSPSEKNPLAELANSKATPRLVPPAGELYKPSLPPSIEGPTLPKGLTIDGPMEMSRTPELTQTRNLQQEVLKRVVDNPPLRQITGRYANAVASRAGQRGLPEDVIRQIRQAYDDGMRVPDIAKKFNIGNASAAEIARRLSYVYVK